jgi:membrane protein
MLLIAGFALLYVVIPNRPVRWRHAMIGGLVAALLFEGLKKLFGYYVGNFPGYETIYGALSAMPLFLVWMYVAWGAILFGAEVAASLPEWRAELGRARTRALDPGERLALALGILALLLEARRGGAGLSDEAIAAGTEADPEQIAPLQETLNNAGYLARTDNDEWMLARDLDEVTLYDLHRIMGLGLATGDGEQAAAWRRRVAGLFAEIDTAERELMRGDLKTLLASPEKKAAAPHIRPVGGTAT